MPSLSPSLPSPKVLAQGIINRKLASVIALAAITLAILIQGMYLHDYHRASISKAERDATAYAVAIKHYMAGAARSVDLSFRTMNAALKDTDMRAKPGQGARHVTEMLRNLKRSIPELAVLGIANSDGIYIFHSGDGVGVSLADREYFKQQRAGGAPNDTTQVLHYGKTTKAWTIAISKRITFENGEFAGVFVIGMDLALIQRFTDGAAPVEEAQAIILTNDFRAAVVSGRHAKEIAPGEISTPTPFINHIRNNLHQGTAVEKDQSGVERIAAFVIDPALPFIVTTSVPLEPYHSAWLPLFIMMAGSTLLSVCAYLMLLYMIRRTYRHQRQLQKINSDLSRAQSVARMCNWTYDPVSDDLRWSPEANQIFEGAPPKKYGLISTLVHPDDLNLVGDEWRKVVSGLYVDFKHRLVLNGKVKWVREQAQFEMQDDGVTRGTGTIQDVTSECEAMEQLRFAASVFDNAHDGIIITSPDKRIINLNQAMERITGFRRDEVMGRTPSIFKSGELSQEFYSDLWQTLMRRRIWTGDLRNRRKNGEIYTQYTSIVAVTDDDHETVTHYIAMGRDVTEDRRNAKLLAHMAYYDTLTDLPNRRLFLDRLTIAMAEADRDSELLVVCYLDLDGFKQVNDTHGHSMGDTLLRVVAKRITNAIGPTGSASRLSGDEFALLLRARNLDDCDELVSSILGKLAEPFDVTDESIEVGRQATIRVSISGSMGVTIYPEDKDDPEALIRHADQSMYIAKKLGKNCYHIFSAESDSLAHRHHELLAKIRHGIENKEFEAFYQPKVDMVTGQVIGAEALCRWKQGDVYISPAEFMHAIEAGQHAMRFTRYMIELVLSHQSEWISKQGIRIPVSINIFPQHLREPSFLGEVRGALMKYPNVPIDLVEFEIVETTHVGNFDTTSRTMLTCQELGIAFSIDDFGTGHSSFEYLKRLPVQTLKIDQSFVRDMLVDEGDLAIVEAIIAIAGKMKFSVIAEGVETSQVMDKLINIGCRYAQGYAFSKPVPSNDFAAWVEGWYTSEAKKRTASLTQSLPLGVTDSSN